MRKIYMTLTALALITSANLNAVSLDAARAQGLVCEGNNGLLVPQGSPSADVQQLISSVNAQRQQEYQKIQQGNGSNMADVMSIAAQQIAASVPSGTYVMDASGNCSPK